MRTLLLLALFLYDVLSNATRQNNYDYSDIDAMRRHSFTDDRRNWRKKALLRSSEHEYSKYGEEEARLFGVGGRRHYEDNDKLAPRMHSVEGHGSHYVEKEDDKRSHVLNCARQHERYEACFAGCAAVTCDNPRERLRPCYPFCEAGCICIHPYVRDDRTHKCVLPEECTKGLKGIPDIGDNIQMKKK